MVQASLNVMFSYRETTNAEALGATVYSLDEVLVQQHKFELKSGGLKAKFFYTHEDAR